LKFLWWALEILSISVRVTLRPFKVIDIGANRKRTCDFLLVCNSNLGPILHRFRDFARARFCAPDPLFHRNFGGVPDRPCWGWCEYLKLFGREIILEIFLPM